MYDPFEVTVYELVLSPLKLQLHRHFQVSQSRNKTTNIIREIELYHLYPRLHLFLIAVEREESRIVLDELWQYAKDRQTPTDAPQASVIHCQIFINT